MVLVIHIAEFRFGYLPVSSNHVNFSEISLSNFRFAELRFAEFQFADYPNYFSPNPGYAESCFADSRSFRRILDRFVDSGLTDFRFAKSSFAESRFAD